MNTTNMNVLLAHVSAENAHRLDETLATLHPECVFEDLGQNRTYRGRMGAALHYREWWDGVDVTVVGEHRSWASDDCLIGEARFKGQHIGSFLGVAATGLPINLPFVVIVEFRDGLMLSERFYYNPLELLRQLNVDLPKSLAVHL